VLPCMGSGMSVLTPSPPLADARPPHLWQTARPPLSSTTGWPPARPAPPLSTLSACASPLSKT